MDATALRAENKRLREERDAARREVKELGKQLAAALKRVNQATLDEIPCFTVVNP